MADAEIPNRFAPAMRAALWVGGPFIALLIAAEMVAAERYRAAVISLFFVPLSVAAAVYWPTIARLLGRVEAPAPPVATERARIAARLKLVKDAGTTMLDPVTIAGMWAGTLDPNHIERHLHFRWIKKAIAQGKLPGTILSGGVNKNARVPVEALERFWREIGVLDDAIGSDNTLVHVPMPQSMGSGNTFVGPTDHHGNTIIHNKGGVAIGRGASADSSGTAIGAGANAAGPQKPILPSWYDLENRFKELEPALQFHRIDGQTGSSGEYWRIAGGRSSDYTQRFEATAAIASARLVRDFPDDVKGIEPLQQERDPVIRWYKALRYIGGRWESDNVVREVNDDGSPGGYIYTGSLFNPAAASATLCLTLAAREPQT